MARGGGGNQRSARVGRYGVFMRVLPEVVPIQCGRRGTVREAVIGLDAYASGPQNVRTTSTNVSPPVRANGKAAVQPTRLTYQRGSGQ